MALVNLARDMIADAIIGGTSYTKFNNANAALGVGDNNGAFNATLQDLQANPNKLRKAMDASYPQRTNNVVVYRSTFSTSEANWAWNEVGVFNATSGSQMLSLASQVGLGTKTSAASWVLTHTQTWLLGA